MNTFKMSSPAKLVTWAGGLMTNWQVRDFIYILFTLPVIHTSIKIALYSNTYHYFIENSSNSNKIICCILATFMALDSVQPIYPADLFLSLLSMPFASYLPNTNTFSPSGLWAARYFDSSLQQWAELDNSEVGIPLVPSSRVSGSTLSPRNLSSNGNSDYQRDRLIWDREKALS